MTAIALMQMVKETLQDSPRESSFGRLLSSNVHSLSKRLSLTENYRTENSFLDFLGPETLFQLKNQLSLDFCRKLCYNGCRN